MLITDSYLGNRFNGAQIAHDAYDNFLKKKKGSTAQPAGAPLTKRQLKKAGRAQKKQLLKQVLVPKRRPFAKKRNSPTGMNSPAAKKTGLFGIRHKPGGGLAKLKQPSQTASTPVDAAETSPEAGEPENPLPDNRAEALADGASNDLSEISDKTPAVEPEDASEAAPAEQDQPVSEPGAEEEQFYAYDLEGWPRGRKRKVAYDYDSFDEPGQVEKKASEKKKGISMGVVLGLLGAAAVGALAMYVVIKAGEETDKPGL